jgi:hypothetical protein
MTPQERAEPVAAIHVQGATEDPHAAPASRERRNEHSEDVPTPDADRAEQVEIFSRKTDERDTTVRRGTENRMGPLLERLKGFRQGARPRRDVASNEERMPTQLGRSAGSVFQPLAEGAAPLGDPDRLDLYRQDAAPGQQVFGRRGHRQPRPHSPRRLAPAACEGREEVRGLGGGEAFLARFATRLPGEEDEQARHSVDLTSGPRGPDAFSEQFSLV